MLSCGRRTDVRHAWLIYMCAAEICAERPLSMVGSAWIFPAGRKSLDPNHIMLLDGNVQIKASEQMDAQNVGEGSMFRVGDGEVSVKFPMICMLHTAAGDATTLKASAYAVPLFMCDEHVRMRICYDAVGTHKTMCLRGFKCYPLKVRSKSRNANTILTAGVRNAVLWPEVLFRLNNHFATNNLHVPCLPSSLAYGLVFPNFLAVFMPENDIFIDKVAGLDADIMRRYCSQKGWDLVQHISTNEKYFLAMVLGPTKALHMLLGPEKTMLLLQETAAPVYKKRKQDDIVRREYMETGDTITSAYSICFSLQGILKIIYDPCYDIFLNLMAVATKASGWQNTDIQRDVAKLRHIQHVLSQPSICATSAHDCSVLGKQVPHVAIVENAPAFGVEICVLWGVFAGCLWCWPHACLCYGMQVLGAGSGLHGMHHDARDVLVSEIVCDAVYNLFFGGFRFTYNLQKSGELICPETSLIGDITSEIRHRLGYMPELCKTEPAQRNLIYLLTLNNLAFHHQKCDDALYNMRVAISFPPIGEESQLTHQLRVFKNTSRVHHASTRRLIHSQHTAYKRTVERFFDDISASVPLMCSSWLCDEYDRVSQEKSVLVACLQQKIDAFEKRTKHRCNA